MSQETATADKVIDKVQETTTADKVIDTVDEVMNMIQEQEADDLIRELWENNQDRLIDLGQALILSVIVVILAWIFAKITKKMIMKVTAKVSDGDDSVGRVLYGIARTIIWLLTFLIVLDLFGVNTASILTVLGAAGLAIGLAMKDSLSNIAAGLMLLILRPYRKGDYVDCGSVSGTIEQMCLFSTILMTVDGIFVSVPNSAIFGTPIKNYSRNALRRADITVGIAYGDSLAKGMEILQALMMKNEKIVKDPAPEVLVDQLADSSVNLTLRFWTTSADYWDVYWMVKAQLKSTIEDAGLNIPFPQRVITFATPIPDKKAE